MILLGAGSSVPFEIPDMKKFVELFKVELNQRNVELELSDLLLMIESALRESGKLIGNSISFDLESLMVILHDLVAENEKPISAPTFALTLYLAADKSKNVQEYNIENVRKTFSARASKLLARLQQCIFSECIKPINAGRESINSFSFLDKFYGPLFHLLAGGQIKESHRLKWIFTTNWDLCLKQWLEYARIGFEDGTSLDTSRKPVLNVDTGWTKGSPTLKVVPLHGGLDLIRRTRYVSRKPYEEIHKLESPEKYFEGNISEFSKAFIIYPLEAVGYDQSVKSPYLDMLNLLKESFREESVVFVVGFSFRDSTIASIFDEVVRQRAQEGREKDLKIFIIDSSPEKVIENLTRQGYQNIVRALLPIQVHFPNMTVIPKDAELPNPLNLAIQKMLATIAKGLTDAGVPVDYDYVKALIRTEYDILAF